MQKTKTKTKKKFFGNSSITWQKLTKLNAILGSYPLLPLDVQCKFCVPKQVVFCFGLIITSLISLHVNSIRFVSNNFVSGLSLKPGSRPGNASPKSFQPGISE